MKTKVLQKLKPKAQSLGFNEEELEGVANQIAGTLAEDATEEQIDKAVELFIPVLQVSQKMATRAINSAKPASTKSEKKKEKEKDSEEDDKKQDEMPAWFKAYKEENDKIIQGFIGEKVATKRKSAFEEKIASLPDKHKEDMLKDFSRMNFTDDADFDAYLAEKTTSIASITQELANKGLSKMAVKPVTGNKGAEGDKVPAEVEKRIEARNAETVAPAIKGLD